MLTYQLVYRTEEHPAFFHSYEYVRGQKLGVIKLNQEVASRMAKDGLRETLHPRHLPMLVKPKPWLSDEDGGYLNNKSESIDSMPRHRSCVLMQIHRSECHAF